MSAQGPTQATGRRVAPMAGDYGRRGRAAGLMDRLIERDALDRLVEAVRAGESRALVVRGDPGVGKTTPRAGYTKSRSACQGRVLDLRQDLRRTLESYGPAHD